MIHVSCTHAVEQGDWYNSGTV